MTRDTIKMKQVSLLVNCVDQEHFVEMKVVQLAHCALKVTIATVLVAQNVHHVSLVPTVIWLVPLSALAVKQVTIATRLVPMLVLLVLQAHISQIGTRQLAYPVKQDMKLDFQV